MRVVSQAERGRPHTPRVVLFYVAGKHSSRVLIRQFYRDKKKTMARKAKECARERFLKKNKLKKQDERPSDQLSSHALATL